MSALGSLRSLWPLLFALDTLTLKEEKKLLLFDLASSLSSRILSKVSGAG